MTLHKVKQSKHWLVALMLVFTCVACGKSTELAVEDGMVEINGTSLYYKRVGSGEPIIVIHGGPLLDHSYLFPHLKPLAKDYQLLFFDQRLSGRSDADADTSTVRVAGFVRDIEGLRKRFGYDRVHLMAHSWGGLLAMRYAIEYPRNLKSLMLLNSISASSESWREEEALIAQRFTREDSLARTTIIQSDAFTNGQAQAYEQLLRLTFQKQFHDPAMIDSLQLYVPEDYRARSSRFLNMAVDLIYFDLHNELSRLTVPTLITYGASEPAATSSGPKLRDSMRDARLVIINKSGHFPFVEQPDTFLSEVRLFLSSI